MGADMVGGGTGWYLHRREGRFLAARDLPDCPYPYGSAHHARVLHDLGTCDPAEAQERFGAFTRRQREDEDE